MNILVKPLSMVSSIDYQTGAVVSKQLLKKNSGNVTLHAFDKNESLNENTLSYDMLIYILEGTVDLHVNGSTNLIKAGEFFILPARTTHSVISKEKTKVLSTVIK
jgi:quercetin dioxygenase-like cupin family protein